MSSHEQEQVQVELYRDFVSQIRGSLITPFQLIICLSNSLDYLILLQEINVYFVAVANLHRRDFVLVSIFNYCQAGTILYYFNV